MQQLALLVGFVYALVETTEKFGLPRKYAHLIALPLGILVSFLLLDLATTTAYITQGLIIGLGAIASCDTLCNIMEVFGRKPSNASEQ